MTKKEPTPADINERNAQFWEEQSRLFGERIAKRPHDLKHAVKKTKERIEDGAIKKVPSLEAQMAELNALRDFDQAVRASGSRKRARGHRVIVIEAMKLSRRENRSLADFLEAAANGSVDGIEITAPDTKKGGRCTVTCTEIDDEGKFAPKTLEGWWGDAKN